jgi:hypothetical protein
LRCSQTFIILDGGGRCLIRYSGSSTRTIGHPEGQHTLTLRHQNRCGRRRISRTLDGGGGRCLTILGLEHSDSRTSRRSAYIRSQVIGVLALPADDAQYRNHRRRLGLRNIWKASNYAHSIIDSGDTWSWSWSFTSVHQRYLIQRAGSLRRLVAMKKLKLCFQMFARLEVSPRSETSRRPATMRTRSSTVATHNLGGSRRRTTDT